MAGNEKMIQDNRKYLELLSGKYPTTQSVCTEIINLRAILNLPKGTEHFMSDLHGEYEAFNHILNNCSGVVREKAEQIFKSSLSDEDIGELCTLVYYPELKIASVKNSGRDMDTWYETALLLMIELCKTVAVKYTRSKVRKALPKDFAYIIDELLHADYGEESQSVYYSKIMESILALKNADEFIVALASLIKRLAVDHLHIVGDIFDRGPRPDLIMDMLKEHHSVDVQWGNHDLLWMGAAAGSEACIAAVLVNSAAFGNLSVLERGYSVNLRELAFFADKTYKDSPAFVPRLLEDNPMDEQDKSLAAKLYKALAIIMFKLEGQLIRRHPEFDMDERLLLDKIDLAAGTVLCHGVKYQMTDSFFPTLDPADPFRLSPEEESVLQGLRESFTTGRKLHSHMRFLYSCGGMYRVFNHNLMFHGCIPMDAAGNFTAVSLAARTASGKGLLDLADELARDAYFGKGDEKDAALDAMWYLWCGKNSPLFGRSAMTTFERLFIEDDSTWTERKNPYYDHVKVKETCQRILLEFGLTSHISHIINGHVPVRAKAGENPVKGGGKLIVIDGGFCRAYHPRTGIAGYTLIHNSHGLRLSAHMPFESVEKAVEDNIDIHSVTDDFEQLGRRLLVLDTDIGEGISDDIFDLSLLLEGYRYGIIAEKQ